MLSNKRYKLDVAEQSSSLSSRRILEACRILTSPASRGSRKRGFLHFKTASRKIALIEHHMLFCGELVDLHSREGFGDEGMLRRRSHCNPVDLQDCLQIRLDGVKNQSLCITARYGEPERGNQPQLAEFVGCRDTHASVQFKVHERKAKVIR